MTFDEFKVLAKGMKSIYTSDRFLPDGNSIKVWYSLLKDLSYQAVNIAIQKYATTNEFPPTVADLRRIVAEMGTPISDWGESWNKVVKALRRYGRYNVKEAMESFDDITRACVERIDFVTLCDSENIMADRAHYKTIYEQVANRKQEELQLPDKLKEQISLIGSNVKQIGGSNE